MVCSRLQFVCTTLALCSLRTTSEPLRLAEKQQANSGQQRRGDDALALSREIFRNITKQLRENIKREGATDKNEHLLHNKVDDSRHGFVGGRHHHEHHWGPYFEVDVGPDSEDTLRVTSHVGSEALLNCRVGMLKDKTVMWLRRTQDSAQLLTVGSAPYTGDPRVGVRFQYPNNWRLSIRQVRTADAGLYMCQVSTHPPRTILTNLTVFPPMITINGDTTHEVKDRYYKAGSSISLACFISDEYLHELLTPELMTPTTPETTSSTTSTTASTVVTSTPKSTTVFSNFELLLNRSWSVETTILSTVSVSTTTAPSAVLSSTVTTTVKPMEINNIYGLSWQKQGRQYDENIIWKNTSSTISIASASQNDTGTYSCHLQNHSQAFVNVHILIGENQAAVHHDTWNKGSLFWKPQTTFFTFLSLIIVCN